ncbi:MAG: transcription elongation factor GreA [Chloroflexota bacterium]|nr:transcription elongation factor GreA [Chloroflexota bacterium]
MASDIVYLTADGKRALEMEMRELLTVRRPSVIERVHDAQTDGDVDDSGSLEEAKDELAQIDARTREIENMLRHAAIIPEHTNGDGTIHLGSHIVVRDQFGDELAWVIVGSAEANSRSGKISSESLVGAALLGKRSGESVAVQAPAGEMTYTIVQVS